MKTILAAMALLSIVTAARADDAGLLLHWKFDEGQGAVAHDASGHGVTGSVTASWTGSATGGALSFDGTPAMVVTASMPAASRLGTSSWTVMGWVKPRQFSIDRPQNQRRLFAYGAYPRAFFCVDLLSSGTVSVYQCYQDGGHTIAAGAGSSTALTAGQWAHVAVVCDRSAGLTRIYINGRLRGEEKLPAEFAPDLSVSGEFTVGNSWQNYWGIADEVRLYRRALAGPEIKGEFVRLKGPFNVIDTAAEAASDAQDAVREALNRANEAWEKKEFNTVRGVLAPLLLRKDAPAQFRSYAHLRIAQSYAAEGNEARARAEYAKIAATTDYPRVHRMEAGELVHELDRSAKGLPARDPAATRVTAPPLPRPQARLYVAPSGSDSGPGTPQRPLATLTAARDRVRAILEKGGRGAIEVILAPGEYRIAEPLTLAEKDSGSAASPVVYRARTPGSVVLYGGTRLAGFRPVTDPAILERLPAEARGKVVQCDLKALGITDYGALAVRGFGQPPSPPTLELYVNRQPMTLARWPNEGFAYPTKLVQAGSKSLGTPSIFGYGDDRHARWTKAEDAWIFGYFHYLWADATARIARIDPVAKTITTAEAYDYGGSGMSTEQGIKYYAFNLLEELDRPGEWYLDRRTGILYLIPPGELTSSNVEISLLARPFLEADRVAHVRFEGLTFDLGRGDGIVMNACSDCQLIGCTVRRMAGSGVRVLGGARDLLLSCDIHTLGRRATEIIGGDRATLTPGGHTVANCLIHDFGRIDRTYTPGIQLEGVGNHITHNLFYNCPSSAMRIEGNDHLIEYNETHHVLQESDDQGAMELFGNPTYRGVVFRNNYFHDIGSGASQKLANGQAGIRLDDAISGMLIYGNVFVRAANGHFGGIQMNSGRDNIIDNNLFADSAQGISGGYYPGNEIWNQLRSGKKPEGVYTTDLYIKRYPEMVHMLEEPAVNHVWRNLFYRVGRDVSGSRATLDMLANASFGDREPGIVDAGAGHVRLKLAPALIGATGFRPIPLDEIGLYPDAWRP